MGRLGQEGRFAARTLIRPRFVTTLAVLITLTGAGEPTRIPGVGATASLLNDVKPTDPVVSSPPASPFLRSRPSPRICLRAAARVDPMVVLREA